MKIDISKIEKTVEGWMQSHHATITIGTTFVMMFAEDAYKVFQATGHVSATDLRSIGLTLIMGTLRSAFEKNKPQTTSATPSQ